MQQFTTGSNPVTVGASLTKLISVELATEFHDVTFEVFNRAASTGTFNDFRILRRVENGNLYEFVSGTDFAAAGGRLIYSSRAVTANGTMSTKQLYQVNQIAPGGGAVVDFRIGGTGSFELWASVASGTATVDVWGGIR